MSWPCTDGKPQLTLPSLLSPRTYPAVVTHEFFSIVAEQGNALFDAWDTHGADKATSRTVVHVLETITALFYTCRVAVSKPPGGKKGQGDVRGISGPARTMARTMLQTKSGAILAILVRPAPAAQAHTGPSPAGMV